MSFNRHRHSFRYTNTDYNVHGAFPLFYHLPLPIPLAPLSNPLSLTWNPPSCDRICPPRSQVACKLTSPFSAFSPTLPPPNSQNPGCQRLTKTTLRIRHLLSRTHTAQKQAQKSHATAPLSWMWQTRQISISQTLPS